MITISLSEIRKHSPCVNGWEKLLKHLGKTKADDEQFPFKAIIDSNGLQDAIWALCCLKDKTPARLFAVACAQEVIHLMEDERSIEAVKIAHLFAYGEATDEERAAADAAYAAAADAAYAAAAAYAAYAAAAAYAADAAYAARSIQKDWLIAIVENY